MKRIAFIVFSACLLSSQVSFADSNVKIIIDAGHGGKDDGSKSPKGDKESDIALQLAEAIQNYAEDNGVATEMTRTKKTQNLTFDQRSGYKPDPTRKTYYISVHFDNDKDPSVYGARVRYSEHAPKSAEAKKLAQTVAKSLEKITGTTTRIEPVDALNFMKNQVPSIIVEPGRMSSPADLQRIKDKSYRKEIAMFIVQAVIAQ